MSYSDIVKLEMVNIAKKQIKNEYLAILLDIFRIIIKSTTLSSNKRVAILSTSWTLNIPVLEVTSTKNENLCLLSVLKLL